MMCGCDSCCRPASLAAPGQIPFLIYICIYIYISLCMGLCLFRAGTTCFRARCISRHFHHEALPPGFLKPSAGGAGATAAGAAGWLGLLRRCRGRPQPKGASGLKRSTSPGATSDFLGNGRDRPDGPTPGLERPGGGETRAADSHAPAET